MGRVAVEAVTRGLAVHAAAGATAKGAAKRGLALLWKNMTKKNAKRFMMEQGIKGIAEKILHSEGSKIEFDMEKAEEAANEKVAEYVMKSAKQYLARSSNQKRLDDVGQAAAKKFVDDVMAFEWTDLVPIWGEVKLCG